MIKTGLKACFLVLLSGFLHCGPADTQTTGVSRHDRIDTVSTTQDQRVSDLSLDSLSVEAFIRSFKIVEKRAMQVRQFYSGRNYQFAWFNEDGITQEGRAFWNLHNSFLNLTKDSSLFNRQLHRQMKALLEDSELERTDFNITTLELELTDHFFDYAQYAYAGKINPADLQWHIPRKRLNAVALLDSLIARNGRQLDEWEPVSQNYKLARKAVLRLYDSQKELGWPQVIMNRKTLREGDSSLAVVQLKQRLFLSGDYFFQDSTRQFTEVLKTAVQKMQRRFGLKPDGVVGPNTLRELNVPLNKRIEQLLVNMERMRWMPAHENGIRLVVNIPEFRLHVYEGNQELFQMKVVVGRAANQTVVFNNKLQYIVFSPYWNVPPSIVRHEIWPAMQQNPFYLSRHNMEKTGTRGGLPAIRQKPGANNALGRVKFLFPNNYNIYFHDTPAKSLFENRQRAFSHGCIRLAQPKKLADFLLRNRPEWTGEKISAAMYGNTEKWVRLKKPVPVEITYFTAWVDPEGRLQFRNDIYGHDKELAAHLFTE